MAKNTALIFCLALCLTRGNVIVTEIKAAKPFCLPQNKIQLRDIKIEIYVTEWEPHRGLKEVTALGINQPVYIHRMPIITNKDIIKARARKRMYEDTFEVEATLNSEAAARMRKLSQEHIDKPLAIVIDGQVIAAPVVISEIGERIDIVSAFTKEQAERIVERLNRQDGKKNQ